MWEFNLVVTMAAEGRFRHLLEELRLYGDFHKSEFLGVVIGRVEDPAAFLETVREKTSRQIVAFQDLGRVIPVERVFTFRADDFVEKVCRAVTPYVGHLAGKRFYVRLERRGLKGRIISPEAEKAVDAFIAKELARQGQAAEIDFEHPDAVIAVETIGDRCGVALLGRELRERYPFVRVS